MSGSDYFLVMGAGGSLGRALLRGLRRRGEERIYGFSRNDHHLPAGVIGITGVDLLDQESTNEMLRRIAFEGARRVAVLHAVGKFKYEGLARHGYDDEVIASNFTTFTNVAEPLVTRLGKDFGEIAFCCFGSVSDGYDIPMWSSYSFAKNKLREELRKQALHGGRSALMVSTSSIRTNNEQQLRPKAKTTHWLRPSEVAQASLDALATTGSGEYRDIDVFRPSPEWTDEYFQDRLLLHIKWQREMGRLDVRES